MSNPSPSLQELTSKLDELPTLPAIAQELTQLIANPMSSTEQIERLMEKDISLTTKVLKLVNSAYYRVPGGVNSLGRAISFLGFDTVHQLVLSTAIFSALESIESAQFNLRDFWKHAVGTAMAAETIAKIAGHPTPHDLFTCGLVHDLGKVAYVAIAPKRFHEILEYAQTHRLALHEAEAALSSPSHADVGYQLAIKWHLPLQVQGAVRFHHERDTLKRSDVTKDIQPVIDMTLLANLFIHGLSFGNSGHAQIVSAPKTVFDRLNLDTQQLPRISKEISKNLAHCESFLKILTAAKPSLEVPSPLADNSASGSAPTSASHSPTSLIIPSLKTGS